MRNTERFSISFYVRKDKIDKNGKVPVFMRVTVNGKRAEIAIKKRFDLKRWRKGQPRDKKTDAQELQKDLDSCKEKINRIYRDMVDRDELITAETIKMRFVGKDKQSKTLMHVFEYHNDQMEKLIGIEYSPSTINYYLATIKNLKTFIKSEYGKDDISLTEINHEFIKNFEYYLKTTEQRANNTVSNYLKKLRKVINLAIKNEWMIKDPFKNISIKYENPERLSLSESELEALEKKKFSIKRIEAVKDIFIFCCYTGLAYSDIAKLTTEDIKRGVDGNSWIAINRTKTKSKVAIPLLDKAKELIEKYKDYPKHDESLLFPVPSNQKTNAYLKEIADLCNIDKRLTFHIARHTFATTVTLTNGISIETVSAMLGHKSIKTTQIYSKVVEQKISSEMNALQNKIKSKDSGKNIHVK